MVNTEAPIDSRNKTSKKTHSIRIMLSLKVEDRGLMIQTCTGKPWTKKIHLPFRTTLSERANRISLKDNK